MTILKLSLLLYCACRLADWLETSRERHKSAPYLRLRNSKRTRKCQRIQSIQLTKSIKLTKNPNDGTDWRAKIGILPHFLTSIVAKNKPKKAERGGRLGFFNIHSVDLKIEAGTLWGKMFFSSKTLTMQEKLKGGLFSLPRYGMLRGKKGKTFFVQFARENDAIWDHKIL